MADDPLKPIATSEQEFILMLHERIISLEKLVDTQQKEIEFLKIYMSSYSIRYNLLENELTNGASILWNIPDGTDCINIIYFDSGRQLEPTKFHFGAHVFVPNETFAYPREITVLLPIERKSHGFIPIKFSIIDLTLKKLLTIIYDFYNKTVLPEDLNDAEDNMLSYNYRSNIIQIYRGSAADI